jgi:hypothetical protein
MTVGPIAHALIDGDLRIIDLDATYREILGVADGGAGQSMLDFVHPGEREAATTILRWIVDGGDGRYFTQRHLRSDGSVFMANLYISGIGSGDSRRLMATCRPLPARQEGPSPVETQWQMARLLIKAIDSGKMAFGESLIGNPATEILLHAYVAEAEAQAIAAGEVGHRIRLPWHLASRWLLALATSGYIETERAGPLAADTPIRLTPGALSMLETIFTSLAAVVQGSTVEA